jgi:Flp pilus assembly protein TadG
MNRIRRAVRRSRGQSLVEFALVFPIAILLLLAVFDAGRAVFLYNGLTNAAREGARLAVVNQDKSLVGQRVQATAFAGSISNIGNLNDLVSYYKQTPSATDPTTNPQCTTVVTGCVAVVIARSTWTAITPIIGQLIGPINFQARSELPVEFVCPNPAIPAYATSAGCPKQP